MGADDLIIIGRVAGSLGIGAMIGFERSFHGRPAGFRTHSLVCIASAILMIVTVYQNEWMTHLAQDAIRTDPTRMAQGIMTGIGGWVEAFLTRSFSPSRSSSNSARSCSRMSARIFSISSNAIGQDFAATFHHQHIVFDSNAPGAGHINTRLDREDHTSDNRFPLGCVRRNAWLLVHLEPEPMARAVTERVSQPVPGEHATRGSNEWVVGGEHTVKAGLNYRFTWGGPPAPRY